MTASTKLAQRIAFAVPALLLAGAYFGEYAFDLFPCEMCWWQRYPHFTALVLAALSFVAEPKRVLIGLAGLAILVSGIIGAYHAGVEYEWWEGVTACANLVAANGGDALQAILDAPLVRCDEVQWSLLGISLAGWNFIFSTASALAIFRLLARKST